MIQPMRWPFRFMVNYVNLAISNTLIIASVFGKISISFCILHQKPKYRLSYTAHTKIVEHCNAILNSNRAITLTVCDALNDDKTISMTAHPIQLSLMYDAFSHLYRTMQRNPYKRPLMSLTDFCILPHNIWNMESKTICPLIAKPLEVYLQTWLGESVQSFFCSCASGAVEKCFVDDAVKLLAMSLYTTQSYREIF